MKDSHSSASSNPRVKEQRRSRPKSFPSLPHSEIPLRPRVSIESHLGTKHLEPLISWDMLHDIASYRDRGLGLGKGRVRHPLALTWLQGEPNSREGLTHLRHHRLQVRNRIRDDIQIVHPGADEESLTVSFKAKAFFSQSSDEGSEGPVDCSSEHERAGWVALQDASQDRNWGTTNSVQIELNLQVHHFPHESS